MNSRYLYVLLTFPFILITTAEDGTSDEQQLMDRRRKSVCPQWNDTYPYADGVDSECWFSVSESTKKQFLHKVTKYSYSLVNFILHFKNVSSHQVKETRCVIQGDQWTWTFPGPRGSRQYLNWPLGYRVWSLGLLNVYTLDHFPVSLRVHGNCQIHYGANKTTQRIALALANLTDYLVSHTTGEAADDLAEYYNQSYWCYRDRIFIESHSLYLLCLNVICPLEAIGYRCCHWKWNFIDKKRTLVCTGGYETFKEIGWKFPFVLGLVLYMYFPLVLVWLLNHVHEITYNHRSNSHEVLNISVEEKAEEEVQLLEKSENWIYYNPIHIGAIIASVFHCCCVKCHVGTSRIVRVIFFFVSISVISLKLLLHGLFQYDDIIASVKKGVPKDFESILAGYELSRLNFLRVFGGPYIAFLFYVVCYILCTCVPSDLAKFLAKGLTENKSKITSPLRVNDAVRVKYGAMKTTEPVNGYHSIYRVILSQFCMILNSSFWKFAVILQMKRWNKCHLIARRKSAFLGRLFLFMMLFYVPICVLELVLCLMLYGVPLVGYIKIITRAYVIAPWRELEIWAPLRMICCIFALFFFTFVYYMFSIIFVDSFIFICGVVVYTYTGLFAHPEATYGYLIFSSTVLLYMFDSINNIASVYDHLFVHTRKICKKMYKYGKYSEVALFKREEECKGIPKDLFFLIVKMYRPIRHQVFISFLKLGIIILILCISVDLLFEFSTARNLNLLTQAAATIIVCLVPKVIGDSCSMYRNRRHHSQSNQIKEIIHMYYQRSKENGSSRNILNLEVI